MSWQTDDIGKKKKKKKKTRQKYFREQTTELQCHHLPNVYFTYVLGDNKNQINKFK